MNKTIDWDKFKSKARGLVLLKAKKTYIELCELLNKNNNKLLSEYVNAQTKVLIDFNCGHKPNWITPSNYKQGQSCPKCSGKCSEQAKEDFLNILKRNNHKLLSEYAGSTVKVLIDFNCGHEPYWIIPISYKRGNRCPKCRRICPEQAKEDFLNILKRNNHKLLSEYVNNKTKVLIDFNCGHKPNRITPNDYKRGKRCPKCSGKCSEQAKEDFLNKLKDNGHELLSEYIKTKSKVLINFNCGHEPNWITPNSYKTGNRCPKCRSEQVRENYLNIIKYNSHKLLSEYSDTETKILIDFNCGHEPHWVSPNNYKNGTKCPKCSGKCSEQAKDDLINLINKNGHKLLSQYINAHTKVLIDFKCGHEPHWINPCNYKNGIGCPKCIHKGEAELHKLLIDMGYEVEIEKGFDNLKDKKRLRYDFYIPKYNLLIELDGDYHREKIIYKSKDMTELEKYLAKIEANERLQNVQYKDKLKDNYAKDNNISLLRIEYVNGIVELDKWKKLIEDKIKEINLC